MKAIRKNRVIRRRLASKVENYIGKNLTDQQICRKLDILPQTLVQYKKKIYRKYQAMLENLDSGAVYSDYLMKSRMMIEELKGVQKKFKDKNGQWVTGAVKVEKDIYLTCIRLGQEFGFIDQKQTELKIAGELEFSGMSSPEIRKEIESEVKKLQQLAKGTSITMRPELIEEADAEDTRKYLPTYVKDVTPPKKHKIRIKAKVVLTKRI